MHSHVAETLSNQPTNKQSVPHTHQHVTGYKQTTTTAQPTNAPTSLQGRKRFCLLRKAHRELATIFALLSIPATKHNKQADCTRAGSLAIYQRHISGSRASVIKLARHRRARRHVRNRCMIRQKQKTSLLTLGLSGGSITN